MHRQEKNNEAHGMSGGGGCHPYSSTSKESSAEVSKQDGCQVSEDNRLQKKKKKNSLMFKGGQVSEQLWFLTRRAKDRSFPVPLDPAVEEK